MVNFKRILQPILNEFRLENCKFNHQPVDDFVKTQWQITIKSVIFLVYRWLVAIFFTITVIISLSGFSSGKYFIYLTNWGILICLLTSLFGACLVTKWYFHPTYADQLSDAVKMPLAFQIYWILHSVTFSNSLVISIIYWSVLHNSSVPLSLVNLLTHAFNSVFVLIDIFIIAHPVRLMHFYILLIFGLVYLLFNAIYCLAGGTDMLGNPYIYPVLDWSKPQYALATSIGCLVLSLVMHFFAFILYKIRLKISKKLKERNTFIPTTVTSSRKATSPVITESKTVSMALGGYGQENPAFNNI